MKFDISLLTTTEIKECKEVCFLRVKLQLDDANNGMKNASYSYGKCDIVNARPLDKRLKEAYMGALAEYIACKCAKCIWTKELGQYKGNINPDLMPIFRGKIVKCDARGTERENSFIYRPRDANNPDYLLIAVTALPSGPICQVGHAFFRDITKLVTNHPEWLDKHPGEPYYCIPIEYLSGDFSEFGD